MRTIVQASRCTWPQGMNLLFFFPRSYGNACPRLCASRLCTLLLCLQSTGLGLQHAVLFLQVCHDGLELQGLPHGASGLSGCDAFGLSGLDALALEHEEDPNDEDEELALRDLTLDLLGDGDGARGTSRFLSSKHSCAASPCPARRCAVSSHLWRRCCASAFHAPKRPRWMHKLAWMECTRCPISWALHCSWSHALPKRREM